jgi:hypothetical protein
MCLVSSPLHAFAQSTGTEGGEGEQGQAGETIPLTSQNDIAQDGESTEGGNLGEEITGGQSEQGSNVTIETGGASSGALLSTDVNSNEVTSSLSTSTVPIDFDDYVLTATGTNSAEVINHGTSTSVTGENEALAARTATIETGDAISVLNIANIVNTNVINSEGFMYLLNQVLDGVVALDLQNLFFPNNTSSLSGACTLMSCAAEDITYNLLNTNNATITNNANLGAISGANTGEADVVSITTGESFGAANIINIANTNIIDSNYRLLAVNGLGTLNGDLVLPSEAIFRSFFGKANGLNQLENAESAQLQDNNVNTASVNNNLNTIAETGSNNATTSIGGTTTTGTGYAASNVVNQVNQNLFGGDSLYMLIRVHGSWNGNVFGLPEGLSWAETAEGIVIHNTGAEIVPSEILNYDIDSYTANFNNINKVAIDNNININSVSGENNLDANVGVIQTGNAYAGANILNIANTNVVGRNWVMAIMNIFGDFNGNISFGRPDLWVGGQVQAAESPVGPGTKLVYSYTVKNNGDLKATDVTLKHVLTSAHIRYQGGSGESLKSNNRVESIGTLLPGETRVVSFDAFVDETIPVGTTNVGVDAVMTMRESDSNTSNNRERLDVPAHRPPQYSQGSYGGGYSQGSYGGGTGTTTPPGYTQSSYYGQSSYYAQGSYSTGGGGGGGGSKKSKAKEKVLGANIDTPASKIASSKPPLITIKKIANVKKNKRVLAGEEVHYTVTVKNSGGSAYNAKVFDRLLNPIGAVVSEQSWDLGTIGAGEIIKLDYTTKYEKNTPSGFYTNIASVVANGKLNDPKTKLKINDAQYVLGVNGKTLGIGNVEVLSFVPMGNGQSSAVITWETSKPADGQVYYGLQGPISAYNKILPNLGYQRSTYRVPALSTKHYMYIPGLTNGTTYAYRLRSATAGNVAFGGDYSLVVPGVPPLAVQSWVNPLSKSASNVVQPVKVATEGTIKPPMALPVPLVQPKPMPVASGFLKQVTNSWNGLFR